MFLTTAQHRLLADACEIYNKAIRQMNKENRKTNEHVANMFVSYSKSQLALARRLARWHYLTAKKWQYSERY